MSIKLPKKGLRFAHLNICSLRNKVTELCSILQENNIHVMAITETHLDENIQDSELDIQGYNIFRLDRDGNGGGTAYYIQEHIPAKIRKDLGMKGVEALWLQVHLPHMKPILTCCCYRPPSSGIEYLDNICTMLQNVTDSDYELLFAADMNVDWFSSNCYLKRKLSDAATVYNLSQIVNLPTRIHINRNGSCSSTCIDHFFTNAPEKCSKAISVSVGISDHNLIATTWKAKVPKSGPKIIHKRMYKAFSEDNFVEDLKNVNWDLVLDRKETEAALSTFTTLLSNICDKHAPIKKRTIRKIKAPWLDGELKKYIKERDLLKESAVAFGCPVAWQEYRALRNKITKMNRQKKKHYYQCKFEECKNDSKKLWRTLNEAVGRDKMGKAPSFIEVDGVFVTKAVDIANYFNNFFINKVNTIRNQMLPVSGGLSDSIIKNKIMKDKVCNFKFKRIRVEEVEKLLLSIKSEKPCGVDHLDGRLLRLAVRFIAAPICHIFNLCFENSVYPQLWKIAKVTPLPKNSREPFAGPNSRPVSILPILSKLMEKIICKQIQCYFEENSINSECQHAYKVGYSTSTALTSLTDNWLKCIDMKLMVGAVLLDFSAAFDIISHELLLRKLSAYNFEDTAIKFMNSYLVNRQQCVLFNGTLSEMVTPQCGVPQGSCLGPLLYSIFVNDLPHVLKGACMEIYADDTTMYVSAENAVSVNKLLQEELMLVSNWVSENRLKLNVLKTKSIMLGSRYMLRSNPELHLVLQDAAIEQVREAKLLGVIIDEILSWSTHINKMVSKMSSNISMIRRGVHLLTGSTVKLVLQSLVLSSLDYCSTIWSSASKQDVDKLQLIQNRAARLALRCSGRSSVEWMHAVLSWMRVDQRLACSLVTFLFNICHIGKPDNLLLQLQPTNTRHGYATRHALGVHFTLPLPRTNALKRSVMYRAVTYWNRLPPHLIRIDNKSSFKKKLKEAVICKEVRFS